MGALVGGVVIDVQVGVLLATCLDVVEEGEQGIPFIGEAVRPVGGERACLF